MIQQIDECFSQIPILMKMKWYEISKIRANDYTLWRGRELKHRTKAPVEFYRKALAGLVEYNDLLVDLWHNELDESNLHYFKQSAMVGIKKSDITRYCDLLSVVIDALKREIGILSSTSAPTTQNVDVRRLSPMGTTPYLDAFGEKEVIIDNQNPPDLDRIVNQEKPSAVKTMLPEDIQEIMNDTEAPDPGIRLDAIQDPDARALAFLADDAFVVGTGRRSITGVAASNIVKR